MLALNRLTGDLNRFESGNFHTVFFKFDDFLHRSHLRRKVNHNSINGALLQVRPNCISALKTFRVKSCVDSLRLIRNLN